MDIIADKFIEKLLHSIVHLALPFIILMVGNVWSSLTKDADMEKIEKKVLEQTLFTGKYDRFKEIIQKNITIYECPDNDTWRMEHENH